jgi:hypothetical protein
MLLNYSAVLEFTWQLHQNQIVIVEVTLIITLVSKWRIFTKTCLVLSSPSSAANRCAKSHVEDDLDQDLEVDEESDDDMVNESHMMNDQFDFFWENEGEYQDEGEYEFCVVTKVWVESRASLVREFRSWPILVALFGDAIHRLRRSMMGLTMLAPLLAAITVWLWSYLGPLVISYDDSSVSFWTTAQSLLISYVIVAILVTILSIQDVLTRWVICAPGTDTDVLMFKARSIIMLNDDDGTTFLVEDLIIQSVLLGDALTVDSVISPLDTKSLPVPRLERTRYNISISSLSVG